MHPNETPLTPHADYALHGKAGETLPNLLREPFEPPTQPGWRFSPLFLRVLLLSLTERSERSPSYGC